MDSPDKPPFTATLVGAGGVASYFLPVFLKTFDITQLTIFDKDILETHNLDRQHFNPKHVGKSKAASLMSTIKGFLGGHYPNRVTIKERYFLEGEDIENSDIIICMADNHPARLACLRTADEYDIECFIACNEYYDSMAYFYKPGFTEDPRLRYPEILTSTEGDPIRCTGDALESTPQLAIANMSSAAKVLELMWTHLVVMPQLQDDIYTVPYELESRMAGSFCKQLTNKYNV